jgi:hypothetical protein
VLCIVSCVSVAVLCCVVYCLSCVSVAVLYCVLWIVSCVSVAVLCFVVYCELRWCGCVVLVCAL